MKSESLLQIHHNNEGLYNVADKLRRQFIKNEDILLIQAPQFLSHSVNIASIKNRGFYAFPPTSLQCLAKVVPEKNIKILDINYEILYSLIHDSTFTFEQWLSLLNPYFESNLPSIIGVTCLTAYTDVMNESHPLTKILQYLKEKNSSIVIVGGPTATNEYEQYLRNDLCHFVITKEGEQKFRYLINLLDDKPVPKEIGNIFYKIGDDIQASEGSTEPLTLSGNLIGTYKYINLAAYKKVGCLNPYSRMAGQDTTFGVFQLNRGCRFNCRFCDVSKFMGRGVRHYPVHDVIEEVQYLISEQGVRHFEVLDDDFLGNIGAVTELLQKMVPLRQQYGITWSANNGLVAASLHPELLNLIRDSGCIGFRIGIESGNPEMMQKIRKPVNFSLLREKAELFQMYPEIFIGANYIIGLFGEETFAKMLDTLRFALEMNLDWSSITTFQFTSKETAKIEDMNSTGGVAGDFIPAKDHTAGEIHAHHYLKQGLDVFTLPLESIPSPEQVKQIWFSFNLIANYIFNKNLLPGGHPQKFVSWVEAVQINYPQNPYMYLFTALGYVLLEEPEAAQKNLRVAKNIVDESPYWRKRFSQFFLLQLLSSFPSSPSQVYDCLHSLQSVCQLWT